MGDLDFSINIDASQMLMELDEVDRKREDVEKKANKTIAFVKKSNTSVYRSALRMARASWQIMDTVFQAAGVSISYQFRALMAAAFGTIQVLIPIFAAEALTPGMQVQAGLGLFELAMAGIALNQTQQAQSDTDAMYRAGLSIINSVQMMIGRTNFL